METAQNGSPYLMVTFEATFILIDSTQTELTHVSWWNPEQEWDQAPWVQGREMFYLESPKVDQRDASFSEVFIL